MKRTETNADDIELKPCPFCGEDVYVDVSIEITPDNDLIGVVGCIDCDVYSRQSYRERFAYKDCDLGIRSQRGVVAISAYSIDEILKCAKETWNERHTKSARRNSHE